MSLVSPFGLLPLVLALAADPLTNLNTYLIAGGAALLADQLGRLVVRNKEDLGWGRFRLPMRRSQRRPGLQSQGRPEAQKAPGAGTRLALTSVFLEKRSLPEGGEVLVYELRSQRPRVWSGQRAYRVVAANGHSVEKVHSAGSTTPL
jgi:hypothetical protein